MALTSLDALSGSNMPSTFLPSYYPERNHHLLPSYARRDRDDADSRSPNPHLLDGISITEPLAQSPHGSPRLIIEDDIPLSVSATVAPKPWEARDSVWAEVPLNGREDPAAMADIKSEGYMADLYPGGSALSQGKDVTAEEYAQVSLTRRR